MNHSRLISNITLLAGLLALTPMAQAQSGPGGPGGLPRGKPTPLNMQPPAGPAGANLPAGGRSLIERDSAGKVKRLATSPATAALGRLPLSAATAATVSSIQQSDSSSWDTWVQANLVKFMKTAEDLAAQEEVQQQPDPALVARDKVYRDAKAEADAKAAANDKIEADGKAKREAKEAAAKRPGEVAAQPATGKAEAKTPATLEGLNALLDEAQMQTADGKTVKSPRTKEGLVGQFAGVLSADEALGMHEMVKEYFDACVAERIADSKANGKEMTVAEATSREMLEGVGAEFKRAFDRTVGQAAKGYDKFADTLGLTDAQGSELKAITGASFEKSLDKASPIERVRMFSKVYQVLTPDQREGLLKQMR